MAIYGLTPFGFKPPDGWYGYGYGPPAPNLKVTPDFRIEPFAAASRDYKTIHVSWTQPSSINLANSPMAVTATQLPGTGSLQGTALTVKVVTGAKVAGSQPGTVVTASGITPPQSNINPSGTGSWIYGAAGNQFNLTPFTPNSSTIFSQNTSDIVNGAAYGTFRSANTTVAGQQMTIGASNPPTGSSGYIAMAEIQAAGTLAEDSSSPPPVWQAQAKTVTTQTFTPPAGSLLVAMVSTNWTGNGNNSLTVSGGGLTWTQVAGNATGIEAVWVAQVPSATASGLATGISAYRLIRNRFGWPMDQNDGEILLDTQTYPGNYYMDQKVTPGKYHYYGFYIQLAGTADVWVRSGVTACLANRDFGLQDWLTDNIPNFFMDNSLVTDELGPDVSINNIVNSFIKVVAWGLNYLKTQYDSYTHVNDPWFIPLDDLWNLGAQLGLNINADISAYTLRKAIFYNAVINEQRGTLNGIETEVSALTGWNSDLRVAQNMMLENDQSTFTDPLYVTWSTNVSYTVGERVLFGNYVYQCILANSAGTAPTGSNTNNSVWNWVNNVVVLSTLLNQTTAGQNTWESVYAASPYPAASPLTEFAGVLNPLNAANFQDNVLAMTNVSGGSASMELRSVSRTNLAPNFNFSSTIGGWIAQNGTFSYTSSLPGSPPAWATTAGLLTTTATGTMLNTNSFPASQNTSYVLSMWVYSSVNSVNLGINWSNAQGVYLSTTQNAVSVTVNTWTQITTLITAPSNSAIAQGSLFVSATTATQTIYAAFATCYQQSTSAALNYAPDPLQVIGDGIPMPYSLPYQQWNATTRYVPNQIVTYNNQPFICTWGNTGIIPPYNYVGTTNFEWAPLSFSSRYRVCVSGYISGSASSTVQVTPFLELYDQNGKAIQRVTARNTTPGTNGLPPNLYYDSFTAGAHSNTGNITLVKSTSVRVTPGSASFTQAVTSTSGNVLVVSLEFYGSSTLSFLTSITDSSGGANTWTVPLSANQQTPPSGSSYNAGLGFSGTAAIAACLPATVGVTSITFNFNQTSTPFYMNILEFSGLGLNPTIDASASATGGSGPATSVTGPAITTHGPGILVAQSSEQSAWNAVSSGWSGITNPTNGSVDCAYMISTGPQSNVAATFSGGNQINQGQAIIAIRQSGGTSIAGRTTNDGNGTWIQESGLYGLSSQNSGAVYPVNLNQRSVAVIPVGTANTNVGITFISNPVPSQAQGLAMRYTTAGGESYLRASQTDLRQITTGVSDVVIGTYTTPAAPGDRLTVNLNGATITCYVNGVQVLQVTSTFNQSRQSFGIVTEIA